jgi:hypothetical protein
MDEGNARWFALEHWHVAHLPDTTNISAAADASVAATGKLLQSCRWRCGLSVACIVHHRVETTQFRAVGSFTHVDIPPRNNMRRIERK